MNKTYDEIKVMSELYHKGFVGNYEIFEEILHKDFREVDADGNIFDREGFINKIKTKHSAQFSDKAYIDIHELEVRRFGDIAMAHALVELFDKGASFGTIRYTDTYKRVGDTWKAIAAHITPYNP